MIVGFAGIGLVALAMSIDPLATEQSVEGHILVGLFAAALVRVLLCASANLMRFVPQEVPGMMISLYTQGLAGVWCVLILLGAYGWVGQIIPVGHLNALTRSIELPGILWGFIIFGAFSMAFLSQAFRFAPPSCWGRSIMWQF